jgi:hypothetical protein
MKANGFALGMALAFLAWTAPRARSASQDEGPPPLRPMGPQAGGDEDEIKRLFLEVERNLKRIDELLNDASSGDVPLAEVGESGLDELLRSTGSESQSVVRGIDEILEVARRRAQSQGQGQGQGQKPGGQGQGPQGESPLDRKRDGGPRPDEATPENPDGNGDPGGQDPRNQQPDGPKPGEGEKPDSPGGSDDPGRNAAGRDQKHDQGDPRANGAGSESWGMLPDKVQEIFRNEGTEDLPVQYRDWIDAYYKRLNAVDR